MAGGGQAFELVVRASLTTMELAGDVVVGLVAVAWRVDHDMTEG